MTIEKSNKIKYIKYSLGGLSTILMIIFITFLLNPFIFIKDLESKIANLVESESGMNLSYSNFSGNFFKGFKLVSPNLKFHKKEIINIESLHVYPGIFSSIFTKHLNLNKLKFINGKINFDNLNSNRSKNASNQINIKLLELQDIEIIINNQNYVVNSKMKIQSGENNKISVFSGFCELPFWPFELEFENGEFENYPENYKITDLEVFSKFGKLNLNGEFLKSNLFNSFANLRFDNLILDDLLEYPLSINNLSFMLEKINSDSSIAKINGSASLQNLDLDNYQINLGFANNKIYLNSSTIILDESKVEANGSYNLKSEIINLNSELDNFSLPIEIRNNLNGHINLTGSIYSDSLLVDLNLINSIANEIKFNKIEGLFLFNEKTFYSIGNIVGQSNSADFNFENLTYRLNENNLKSNGSFTFNEFSHQLNLKQNIHHINLNGDFIGEINLINNEFTSSGLANLNNIKFNDNFIEKINSKVFINKSVEDFILQFEGTSNNFNTIYDEQFKLDTLSYSINVQNEKIQIDYANGFTDKKPTLFIKKMLINSNSAKLEELFLNYKDVEFLTENLLLNQKNENWKINNHQVKINDDQISISANFNSLDNFEIVGHSEKINFNSINSVLGIPQRLTGILNGDFTYFKNPEKFEITTNSTLANGQIDEINFDSLLIDINIDNKKIDYKNIVLIKENQNLLVNGIHLPNKEFENSYRNGKIELKGSTKNFDIEKLNNYIPISLNIDGNLTSDFNISGTPENPEINLILDISNPQFDKIYGENLTGEFSYKNEISKLENLNLKTNNGTYIGNGIVPLNLNIFGKKSNFYTNPKLNFTFSGQTTEFEFLTPYFEIIDSINGQINLELNISGSHANPVRNGNIEINQGKLNLMPLENTIYGINGFAEIDDNILKIEKLTGITGNDIQSDGIDKITSFIKSIFGSENNNKNYEIVTNGEMNLTEFFNPQFNISIESPNVYLSSIHKSYKGNATANFEITGKDTIYIDGVFNPLPNKFTFLMEFEEDSELTEENIDNGKTISYDIHIPLENGVRIENSQMDGLIDGDIVLSSIGNEPFTFSGNINVVDGSFYFNGNTIDQISGNILLDPAELDPIIDFTGITNVAGKDIELSLNGEMDNPNLLLESISDPDLTQDDLLYLLVFTPDSSAQGDGLIGTEQVGNLITNYVENTLERNIVQNSLLDKFQFNTQGGTLLSGFENSHLNLYLGKNISPNLYLNLRSDLNTENSTFQYEVGYRLSRNMSIIGRIDEKQMYHLTYRFKYKY